jgi:hypothetical protein
VLGGITRLTVSVAVIMFEATGGLETIVPIMVAVVCSKWFGDAIGKQGLYGCLIQLNGLPHVDTHADVDLVNPAVEMMSQQPPVCLLTYGETLATIQSTLLEHGYHGFPIIDNEKDRLVTGYIARADLELKIAKLPTEDLERQWAYTDSCRTRTLETDLRARSMKGSPVLAVSFVWCVCSQVRAVCACSSVPSPLRKPSLIPST